MMWVFLLLLWGGLAILVLGTLLLIWVLVMPSELILNTQRELYMLRLARLFSLQIVVGDAKPMLVIRLLGYRLQLPPRQQKKAMRKLQKARRPKTPHGMPRFVYAAIRRVKVRRCLVQLDTGDYVTNALLIPVFHWVNLRTPPQVQLGVNFEQHNMLDCHLHLRPYRLLGPAFYLLTHPTRTSSS